MSTLAKINKFLKKAGRTERLIRGRGYYYIPESLESGLYVNKLEDDEQSMQIAVDFMNETISSIDGKPFTLVV
jgi:hypothetical protein